MSQNTNALNKQDLLNGSSHTIISEKLAAKSPEAKAPAAAPARQTTKESLRDFALAAQKQDRPAAEKAAVATGTEYIKHDDTSLMIIETTKMRRSETLINFTTGFVSQEKIYCNGQVKDREIALANYTDVQSIERIRQKLIGLGGTPPIYKTEPSQNKKEPPKPAHNSSEYKGTKIGFTANL